MMMKTTTAPIFLTSEAATATAMEEEYNGHGLLFDPKLDFSQFLEEARKNRPSVLHPQASSLAQLRNETQKKMPEEGKKKKKSWKTSLFSWIKVDKKSKPARGSAVSPHTSNQRPGSLSGPIYGSGRKVVQSQHVRRGASDIWEWKEIVDKLQCQFCFRKFMIDRAYCCLSLSYFINPYLIVFCSKNGILLN